MPVVQLGDVRGSLDWLLALARQHAIDLATISIRALVDQFVAALDAARDHVPLERRADWLVTASWFVAAQVAAAGARHGRRGGSGAAWCGGA
jgi:chromatin segregation and condensation protein Rec8/ScpA/Scc1 (kleisin family)